MKKDIHPKEYRKVLFVDNSNGAQFLISSTAHAKETLKAKADGKEYPVFYIETSSASHPFYTGNDKIMDTAGRIDRFKAKQAKAAKKVKK